MKKLKIDRFAESDIYFDKEGYMFTCNYGGTDYAAETLTDLKHKLSEASVHIFTGEFFITDYNGIKKFTANRKRKDVYSGKTVVRGIELDRYGSKRDENVDIEDLYPVIEENQRIYDEHLELINKGWDLIKQGENMKRKLVKINQP